MWTRRVRCWPKRRSVYQPCERQPILGTLLGRCARLSAKPSEGAFFQTSSIGVPEFQRGLWHASICLPRFVDTRPHHEFIDSELR